MSQLVSLYQGALPRLVLFDLDGTLIDSVPDLADAVDAMLLAHQLPPAGEERVRHWVGNGSKMLVRRALAWGLELPDPGELGDGRLDQGHADFLAAYRRNFHRRTQLYPGVRDFLEWLHQQRIPMGLVTNKPEEFVAPLLEHFGLAPYFGLSLGGDSLPRKKPDPLPLLHSCEHFQVKPEQALMVGDSRNDVLAARACGMPVVCVSYGYNHGEPIQATQPDRVIDSLAELL